MGEATGLSTSDERLAESLKTITAEGGECFPPFRWQMRLLHHLLQGDLPTVVDVPTGLGKTTVMALWLVALAEGASLPRRLVYVVDRRAVVDQATVFAERLRDNMPPELLDGLGFSDGSQALPISTLRGGFADNRDWLEDPARPAVIVGTIDMIGSRLLFEGYGVSRRMRPYHAGLLGADSLVVLDEAHLCPPFEALLRQIAAQRDGELGPLDTSDHTPPFHLMSLSATGREVADAQLSARFALEDEDRDEPVVRQRLTAGKRLKLVELADPKSLAERIAGRAIELGAAAPSRRVLVYCDRRRDAVDVKTRIDKQCRHAKSELLVGERRVYERAELALWLECNGFLGDADAQPSEPTFLVATSAGEVGVDLDADHMVCDLVSYERLVQRLGRVNRRGGHGRVAMVDVFALRPEVRAGATKAQRDRAESATRTFERHVAPLLQLERGADDRSDASSAALIALKSKYPEIVRDATSPAPLHPPLSRPLVDAWAMTSLKQHEGRPEVAPWLRGWEEDEAPQSSVVWRKYLPRTNDGTLPASELAAFFRAAPIHATERLEADSSRVFDWLVKRAAKLTNANASSDSIRESEIVAVLLDREGELVESATLACLRQLGASAGSLGNAERRERDRHKSTWKERHLPGNLLVVDHRVGGCRDGMLDDAANDHVASADDEGPWQDAEDPGAATSRPMIRFRIKEATGNEDGEGLELPDDETDWRLVRTFETRIDDGGVAQHGLAVYKWHDDATDEESRSILSTPQLLSDHACQVAERVRAFAERLNLPDGEAKALVLAGKLHDDGKAAPRWQRAMNAPTDDDKVYAKTKGGGNLRLLEGYRHEFGSLVMAEKALAQREDLSTDLRDLTLHLIAAHHGLSRPLISCDGCDEGPPSQLESTAGEAALRFARLQRKYGPWGLAWREAILRAADQAVSREWSETHRVRRDG